MAEEARRRGFLDWVEWAGNKLPEPAILFALLAAIVFFASGIASRAGWSVQPFRLQAEMVPAVDATGAAILKPDGTAKMTPKLDERGKPIVKKVPQGDPLRPRSLMTSEGIFWMLSSMIRNFVMLPALGLVFVGMLGIGLAEKFGMFSALMRALAMATPKKLLTPVIVFIGANAAVASDAGYIILPPLAAALYLAMGRHPVAGLAAAFAGVAGGFGGGCFPNAADGVLAGEATRAAQILNPDLSPITPLHNLYFKIGSAVVVMLAGWFVTDRIIEPRLKREAAGLDSADTSAIAEMAVNKREVRGLFAAGAVALVVLGVFAAIVMIPGAPLHGKGQITLPSGRLLLDHAGVVHPPGAKVEQIPAGDGKPAVARVTRPDGTTVEVPPVDVIAEDPLVITEAASRARTVDPPGDRWSLVIVPLILFVFMLPGMAFGLVAGTFRTQKDFVDGIYHGIRTIVPVLAIAFFMAQFAAYFTYSGMDRMLAFAGGSLLLEAQLPIPLLIVMFVLLVVAGDFAISGMLSKYLIMAPIFIPMFMMVGKSAELTTAAYRIGDSVVNIITPLNSYLLIILAVLQKYRKDAGLGSLISLMLPYSIIFFVVWTGFLLLWYALGLPLGPGASASYDPVQ